MKQIKKLGMLILAFALALSLAACSDTSWAFDYNGEKIPAGLYIAYTMEAYRQAAGRDDLDPSISDLMKQTIEGKDASTWIKDTAKDMVNKYVAINHKFDELGLSLTDDQKNSIDASVNNYFDQVADPQTSRTVEDIYMDNGVSRASYRLVVENNTKNQAIFDKYYDKGGLEEVPYEDLFAYFKENFASVNFFPISLKTAAEGEELSDEEKTANDGLKAKADEYVQDINNTSMSFNEARQDYSNFLQGTTTDAAAVDIKADADTTQWLTRKSTYPSENFVKAVFDELKPDGTAQLIKDGDTYYVTVRYDVTKDEKNFDDMRKYVLSDIKGDDYKTMVDGWTAQLNPIVNTAAVNRYAPKNIHFS